MSWGDYHHGQGPYGPRPWSDPDGRTDNPSEPGGYVTNDPYAPPGYNQAGYDGPGDGRSPYRPPYQFGYDAAHPPRPEVGFVDAIKLFFKNYAVFHGRASRSEFWWVYLAGAIASTLLVVPLIGMFVFVASTGTSDPSAGMVAYIMLLVMLSLSLVVPSISLQVRRLHDAGFSGFFSLFSCIPYFNYITWLVPLIMSIMPSKPEGVKYDNPNGSQPATL
jgi:uncharacterized membrane protein YhaH (DUF805 family)